MTLDGCKLKETGVRLLLSSRAEMQKVIETARQQTVSVFQLNTAPTHAAPPVVPPQIMANPQLLIAQQLIQQQQAPQIPFHSNVAALPVASLTPKLDYNQTVPGPISRNRSSLEKRDSTTTRHRDRSRSRDRDRRDRSRSTSRDRTRRRSRSRSRDRVYRDRKRRDRRSYSRDEYDTDESDSRGSSGGSGRARVKPTKSTPVWDNQDTNSFRAQVYNNDIGNGRSNTGTAALQQLRERRNESLQDLKQLSAPNDGAIDLTNDDHNCCVKVSNIERTTGYGELRRFFQGLPVRQNGLKMINDDQGKRTGVAYVRFHRPESCKFAIMRSGQTLNGNKLTVVTLDDNEFEEAVDSYRPPISSNPPQRVFGNGTSTGTQLPPAAADPNHTPSPSPSLLFDQIQFTCLKVTDVPSLTTEQDIMKVFSEYGLMHIIIAKDKQKRHCAFIKLNRPEDAKRALKEKHSFQMAHKVITVTMCSEAVFEEVMNARTVEDSPNRPNGDTNESASPESQYETKARADKKAGSRWGEKVEVTVPALPIIPPVLVPNLTVGLSDNGGVKKPGSRWSAEPEKPVLDPILSQLNLALPFLNTLLPQAAAAIKSAEQQQQQQTQLPAAAVSRDPRLKNIPANNNPRGVPNDPRNQNPRFNPTIGKQENTDCVVISNLEASCTDLDVASFFSKSGIVPQRVHILLNTNGAPSGDAFVEFTNATDAHAALLQNERLLGNNPVFVETIPRGQVDEVLASFKNPGVPSAAQPNPMFNQFNGMNPGLIHGPSSRMPLAQKSPFPAGNVGVPVVGLRPAIVAETNVLALNNVPYRAGVEDIIEFFKGYDIRPQDVMRRFNDQGQATAEAKVRFKNPVDARKAFEQKKFGKMSGRTIYLAFDH